MVYILNLPLALGNEESAATKRDRVMQVMLYKPPLDDPFINRAVAWIDGPFSHVEVGFEDGMASSIYAGESVFMHHRTFSNPNYAVVSISVTGDQESKARKFCNKRVGTKFDGIGMYTARLPRPLRWLVSFVTCSKKQDSTFCSKYVVEVMQHINMQCFMGMDPSGTSPSMVHRVLQERENKEMSREVLFGTTPYRRALLSTDGVVM